MRRVRVAMFAISCVLGASFALVPRASAWWRHVHVSGCTMSPYATNLGMVYTGSSGGYYNLGPTQVLFQCSTEHSSDHPKEAPSLSVWSDPSTRYDDAYIAVRLPPYLYAVGGGAFSGYTIGF